MNIHSDDLEIDDIDKFLQRSCHDDGVGIKDREIDEDAGIHKSLFDHQSKFLNNTTQPKLMTKYIQGLNNSF